MSALSLRHWLELPQVSFLSRQTPVSCDKNVFIATNRFLLRQTCVCHDTTCLLSRQKYACRDKIIFFLDKTFVATNICRDEHVFVCLSRHRFCLDKHTFVATKDVFLLRQKYACQDNTFVAKEICLSRPTFIVTQVLSRQAMLLSRTKDIFCRDKHVFVVTTVLS